MSDFAAFVLVVAVIGILLAAALAVFIARRLL